MRCCTAHVFGCLECEWEGEEVSVLVMERVPWDFHQYAAAWFQVQPAPEAIHALLFGIGSFFLVMRLNA